MCTEELGLCGLAPWWRNLKPPRHPLPTQSVIYIQLKGTAGCCIQLNQRGSSLQLNREASSALLSWSSLCRKVVFRSKISRGESYGEHFLHMLSTFELGPGGKALSLLMGLSLCVFLT